MRTNTVVLAALAGALLVLGRPALAAGRGTVSIDLPEDHDSFRPGPGLDWRRATARPATRRTMSTCSRRSPRPSGTPRC